MSNNFDDLLEEYTQLSQRIDRLKEFIVSESYDKLTDIDRSDIKKQLVHMEHYFNVLSYRVSRKCSNS